MNKKKLSILAATVLMTASLSIPVHAADGDIYDISSIPGTDIGSIGHVILNDRSDLFKMVSNMDNYGYEVSNNVYKLSDVNNDFNSNPTFTPGQLQADVKLKCTPTETVLTSSSAIQGDIKELSPFGQEIVLLNPAGGAMDIDTYLPPTEFVTLNDGTTTSLSVTWDDANPQIASGYGQVISTYTGLVKLPAGITNSKNLTSTITIVLQDPNCIPTTSTSTSSGIAVNNIIGLTSSVETTYNVPVGTQLSSIPLPGSVTADLSNNMAINVPVTWNSPNGQSYNPNVPGFYTLVGTLTLPPSIVNTNNCQPNAYIIVTKS